jgi:hypothetical protein
MTLDLPALIQKAREGKATALRQLESLKAQGVELPPAALAVIKQNWQTRAAHLQIAREPEPQPKPEQWTQAEKDLQIGVVSYLQGLGFEVDQTFIGKTARGKVFKTVGTPDLFAARAGHQIWIELKTATGKTSEAQDQWHERFRRQGVTVLVCRSIYEVEKGLREAGML